MKGSFFFGLVSANGNDNDQLIVVIITSFFNTLQKMKFSTKISSVNVSKYAADSVTLTEKCLIENFIFCEAVFPIKVFFK